MKKLNGNEIDVLVNEIVNKVKEVKLNEVKKVLEVDSNYKEIVNLYDEKYELKKKLDLLEKEIDKVNIEINKDFKVKIYCRNNSCSSVYLNDLFISFDYKDEEKYSYLNVRSKVILSSISKEFNVEEFIKKFVDEFVS
jgi:ABC-type phosphate transport system auxiliary subunit